MKFLRFIEEIVNFQWSYFQFDTINQKGDINYLRRPIFRLRLSRFKRYLHVLIFIKSTTQPIIMKFLRFIEEISSFIQ